MKNSHFYEGQAGKNTHVCQGWLLSFCIKNHACNICSFERFRGGLTQRFFIDKSSLVFCVPYPFELKSETISCNRLDKR